MYNEIKRIICSDGDCLIFHVNTDLYENDDLINLEKEFEEKMPNLKILFVPHDLIDDITHVNNNYIIPICNNNINHNTLSTTPITTSYSDEDMNPGWSKID